MTEHGIFQSCFIKAVSIKITDFSLKIIESQILYYQFCANGSLSPATISCSEIISLEKQLSQDGRMLQIKPIDTGTAFHYMQINKLL